MRISTFPAILSVALFLSSYANAYRYDENEVYAREPHNLDTSSHKFTARDLLSELSTRELVDELKRRKYTPYYPKAPPRPLSYPCKACGSNLHSASQLTLHKKDKHDEGTCDKCGVYHSKNLKHHMESCQGRAK